MAHIKSPKMINRNSDVVLLGRLSAMEWFPNVNGDLLSKLHFTRGSPQKVQKNKNVMLHIPVLKTHTLNHDQQKYLHVSDTFNSTQPLPKHAQTRG